MKVTFIFLVFACGAVLCASDVKTEDLGSIKKSKATSETTSASPTTKTPIIDYTKLKQNPASPSKKTDVKDEDPIKNLEPEASDDTGIEAKDTWVSEEANNFYKNIGNISIRASKDYVYIRAGKKSSIIMNSQGKILIESSQDLIFSSQNDIIIQAKRDIVFRPGGKFLVPKQEAKETPSEEKPKTN